MVHHYIISYAQRSGFGEFADDAEVAFWTGILGKPRSPPSLQPFSEDPSSSSCDFLSDPIRHVSIMGTL
jgi:hypothetical protein